MCSPHASVRVRLPCHTRWHPSVLKLRHDLIEQCLNHLASLHNARLGRTAFGLCRRGTRKRLIFSQFDNEIKKLKTISKNWKRFQIFEIVFNFLKPFSIFKIIVKLAENQSFSGAQTPKTTDVLPIWQRFQKHWTRFQKMKTISKIWKRFEKFENDFKNLKTISKIWNRFHFFEIVFNFLISLSNWLKINRFRVPRPRKRPIFCQLDTEVRPSGRPDGPGPVCHADLRPALSVLQAGHYAQFFAARLAAFPGGWFWVAMAENQSSSGSGHPKTTDFQPIRQRSQKIEND